jgi:hypothetical protein
MVIQMRFAQASCSYRANALHKNVILDRIEARWLVASHHS